MVKDAATIGGNRTKFSVSMCVYWNDDPQHFGEALKSIMEQSREPDEIVLVVDGPIPEDTRRIISCYEGEPFFKVIFLPRNLGHGNARRIGLQSCSNEIIALMDADDISVRTRFERQLECLERNEHVSIVGSNIREFIGDPTNVVGVREVPQVDHEIKEYMKRRCPLNQVTVMFRRSAVEAAGGYKDWPYEEDYFLWIRMYQNGAVFKNLEDCLVYVRVGEEMYQRRGGWAYFSSEARLQTYMWKHGIISTVRLTINIIARFVVQIAMPNSVRGYVFRKFARKQI